LRKYQGIRNSQEIQSVIKTVKLNIRDEIFSLVKALKEDCEVFLYIVSLLHSHDTSSDATKSLYSK